MTAFNRQPDQLAWQLALGDLAAGRMSIFDLEQERSTAGAWHAVQHPGYHFGLHRRHGDDDVDGRTSASGVIVTVDHFATHVDAFSHQAVGGQMYDGVPVSGNETAAGFRALGAETIDPMVRRGVLVDAAAAGMVDGPSTLLTDRDLRVVLDRQGTQVEPGDVVLVRTGWGRYWAADNERYRRGPGMAASASRWLADQDVHAVGADNMAWDAVGHVDPEVGDFPGHVLLLVQAGIYIFENLRLESLSEAGVHDFLFVAAPLKYTGATAGPVRPLAIGVPTNSTRSPG